MLAELAAGVLAVHRPHPVRVAVDGVDGAGKTTLAEELGTLLTAAGRSVVRASVDGFHQPRADRYRRGRHDPDGFYLDSYGYDRFRAELLEPLGPGGSRRYRTAVFDHQTDRSVEKEQATAPADAVLVVDGIFLHRPELRDHWDHSILLLADFTTTFARMAVRDGCPVDPAEVANRRYVLGQRHYLDRCRPAELADRVVRNDDLASPVLLR